MMTSPPSLENVTLRAAFVGARAWLLRLRVFVEVFAFDFPLVFVLRVAPVFDLEAMKGDGTSALNH